MVRQVHQEGLAGPLRGCGPPRAGSSWGLGFSGLGGLLRGRAPTSRPGRWRGFSWGTRSSPPRGGFRFGLRLSGDAGGSSGELAHQPALATRRLVLVDHALGRRCVQLLRGKPHARRGFIDITRRNGDAGVLDIRAQRRANGTIPGVTTRRYPLRLQCRLRVRQGVLQKVGGRRSIPSPTFRYHSFGGRDESSPHRWTHA